MAASEAMKRAIRKYDKENTKQLLLKLNKKTDSDILEKLDEVENKQGYVKGLIREDIKNCSETHIQPNNSEDDEVTDNAGDQQEDI